MRSRLPVPVRPSKQTDKQELTAHDTEEIAECHSRIDSEQTNLSSRPLKGTGLPSSSSSSSDAIWSSEASQREKTGKPDVKPNADRASGVQESELLIQLELLNQECQEKEEVISQLQLQLQTWDGLQADLQEKEKLNSQYLEALQAAESTIAYLTACSLDAESGIGQSGSGSDLLLRREVEELQRAVQEKDQLNAQLLECLNTAESAVALLTTADKPESPSGVSPEPRDSEELCDRLEGLLSQIKALQDSKDASTGTAEKLSRPDGGSTLETDLQRQAESLQESLLRQCRLNAELQEKLRSAEETITKLSADANTAKHNSTAGSLRGICSQGPLEEEVLLEGPSRLIACLSECVLAAEQAVESVAGFFSRLDQPLQGSELSAKSELDQNLERLQRAFLEKGRFGDPAFADIMHSAIAGPLQNRSVHTLQIPGTEQLKTSTPISQGNQGSSTALCQQNPTETWFAGQAGATHLNLHKNLLVILQLLKERDQKLLELEKQLTDEERNGLREEGGVKSGDAGSEQTAQESLQKIKMEKQFLEEKLREKEKVCQTLEEKLAAAQFIVDLQNSAKRDKHATRRKGEDNRSTQTSKYTL